jgi:hypothetical protein
VKKRKVGVIHNQNHLRQVFEKGAICGGKYIGKYTKSVCNHTKKRKNTPNFFLSSGDQIFLLCKKNYFFGKTSHQK